MSNLLLLNPPAPGLFIRDYYCSFESKADYYWPPQDLLALSGILSKKKEVSVIDAIIDKQNVDDIIAYIRKKNINTLIFTTGTATFKYDINTIERIKKETGVFIIASSGIIKYEALKFFRNFPSLDAALVDFTDPEIVDFIDNPFQKKWNTIWVRNNGSIVGPKNIFRDTFFYPSPLHELFPYKRYFIPIAKKHPFAVVITTMGCPYQCRFCTIPAYGTKFRDITNSIEEMQKIKDLGFKEILFQDPTFTVNTKFVTNLLYRMIEEKFNFSFSCNSDVNSMNEDKISLLKRAGCHTVNIGLESGNDQILERYNKKLNKKKVKEVLRIFKKYKIRTLGYFIIGLPGDTEETIEETINFARSLKLDFASFAIATPDLGSELRTEAIEKGWIKEEVDFFDSTQNPILNVPGLSIKRVKELRNRAELKFYFRPSYIFRRLAHVKELKETFKNGTAMLKRILFR